MARTQAADYDERCEAILDKAAELYAVSSFHGTSISELADACGMSKSLLYHYFSSKDDILFEVMNSHVSALQQMADSVAEERDPERRLRALTHGFMELYVDAAARQKVLVNDLDKLPKARRNKIVATERRLIDLVGDTIAKLSRRLATNAAQRRAVTMLYFGMINWTHTWFEPMGSLKASDIAELTINIFLNGIKGR